MRRNALYAIKGIGILLFIAILARLDVRALWMSMSKASSAAVILTLTLFLPIYALKCWRWHVLVRAAGSDATLHNSVQLYMSGLFLGIITPGKIGEALKIPALRAHGLRTQDAVGVTVIDRLLDVLALGFVAIWAAAMLFSAEAAGILGLVVALGITTLVAGRRVFPQLHAYVIPTIDVRSWCVASALTAANWLVYFLQAYVLARGFAIAISPAELIAIMTFAGIISVLPIAPAGLGTRDAALLYFFGLRNIAPETTVAFSFTIFALTMLASGIGAYYWLRYPLRKGHAAQ